MFVSKQLLWHHNITGLKLLNVGIKVSLDGKGRALDNIYIERFWCSIKHEWIYLHCINTIVTIVEMTEAL